MDGWMSHPPTAHPLASHSPIHFFLQRQVELLLSVSELEPKISLLGREEDEEGEGRSVGREATGRGRCHRRRCVRLEDGDGAMGAIVGAGRRFMPG